LTQASVNYNEGEIFVHAIRNFRSETFHLLLSQNIGHRALYAAVGEALKAPKHNRKIIFIELMSRLQHDHINVALTHIVFEEQPDISLAKLLLDSGADAAHNEGSLIKHAACNLNSILLNLLARHAGHNEEIFTQAFMAVINKGKQWIAPDHLELVDILLHNGASPNTASRAVVEVTEHLACKQPAAEFGKALLLRLFAAKADVNYEHGKALSIAASCGDPFLVSFLLEQRATAASATRALSAAIFARHSQETLLPLLLAFAGAQSCKPNFNQSLRGTLPPIFLCLKNYPSSVVMLDTLVDAGCNVGTTIQVHVCPPESIDGDQTFDAVEAEPASVLIWALLQNDEPISSEVIKALVHHGGK